MCPVDLAEDVCVATIYKILEQATSYKLRPTSYKLQSTHHQPMLQSTIYKLQDCSNLVGSYSPTSILARLYAICHY